MRLYTVLLAVALGACNGGKEALPTAAETPPKTATVFLAKKIHTMDSILSVAQAVAVQGDKVLAVGSLDAVRRMLPTHELFIDERFADKVLMPGFIDNHLHPALAGVLLPARFITPYDWQLPGQTVIGVQGQDAFRQRLIELEGSMPDPDEMLISWGYHQLFHGELNRADLDEVSTTRPIVIWQRSFHEIIVNTAALNRLGIEIDEFVDHPAIDIDKGHFWETGLFAIFPKLAPIILDPERFDRGMRDGLLHAQMNGITTVCDQGVPLFNLDREMNQLGKVIERNELPLNMLLIGNAKSLATESMQQGFEIMEQLPQRNNAQLTFLPKQVKLLADGAFYSQLMQMQEGYLDGHEGEWITEPEALEAAARMYWLADYQLHIHVNGDLGVKLVLDIIERLNGEKPRDDHRTVLHHYGYSAENQAERVSKLGVSVSANPFYLWALGDKYSEVGIGAERAQFITRLGDLERNAVPVSFHSDLPMAPASPLTLAGVAASRVTANGNVLAPAEKMSVAAALKGITIEAARAIQQEHLIGSIEPGKAADFAVLNSDPFEIAPENFRDIGIWGTVYRGVPHPRPVD